RGLVLRAGALSFVARGAIFAIWLLAPFYLVETRRLGAFAGGFFFMLTPLGTTVAAPLAGRLADRLGPSAPAVAGLAIEAVGLAALGFVGGTTPLSVVGLALFVAGFGLGFFEVPNMTTIMTAFPAGQQGAAGGLSFLARTLGVVTGVAVAGQIVAARTASVGFLGAFTESLLVAALAVAPPPALAVAGLRGGRSAPRGAILLGHEGGLRGGADGGCIHVQAVSRRGCRRGRVLLPAGVDRRPAGRSPDRGPRHDDARRGPPRSQAGDRVHHQPVGLGDRRESRDQRRDGRLPARLHGGRRRCGRGVGGPRLGLPRPRHRDPRPPGPRRRPP